jgi:hypothetical protein
MFLHRADARVIWVAAPVDEEQEMSCGLQALAVAILTVAAAPAAGIVDRAEKTELWDSAGKPVKRVLKDADGNVTELVLNNMQLKPKEVVELEGLSKLRRVILYRTNFGDDDLKHLAKCKNIESLNLTSTNVSDDAVKVLLEFKNLKYLCLGDDRVTLEAVKTLKDKFRSRKQDVRLGYSQRKQ